jgi:hypothetical protein
VHPCCLASPGGRVWLGNAAGRVCARWTGCPSPGTWVSASCLSCPRRMMSPARPIPLIASPAYARGGVGYPILGSNAGGPCRVVPGCGDGEMVSVLCPRDGMCVSEAARSDPAVPMLQVAARQALLTMAGLNERRTLGRRSHVHARRWVWSHSPMLGHNLC